jgi:hypothetical protein
MDGQSGRPGVSSSGTQPPTSVTSYSGNYSAGIVFQVTQGGTYFEGYWWYVPTGGDTSSSANFALWQINGTDQGTSIPASIIAWPGVFTAGQWNFIPCNPIPLTPNIPYEAVISYGTSVGYPATQNQFGGSQPYAGGITNGPLSAYGSTTGAGSATTGTIPQSPYSNPSGIDPAYYLPTSNNNNAINWLDVQITTQVPPLTPERAWPNMPAPWPAATPESSNQTLGMEFSLSAPAMLNRIWHYAPYGDAAGDYTAWKQSTANTPTSANAGTYTFGMEFAVTQSCNIEKIWFFSAPGALSLPTAAAIYQYGNTTALEQVNSPTWSGAAGSGWVSCDLSGTTAATVGNSYYVATFGTGTWWSYNTYWGPSGSGVSSGPIAVPASSGSKNGQGVIFNGGSGINYPSSSWSPYNAWMDVTVTPSVIGALPSDCAIWDTSTQAVVPGTHKSSPTWLNPDGSAASGPGWIYCDYSSPNLTLPAGTYAVSTYSSSGSPWYTSTSAVFSTGLQKNGFTQDVLTIPGNSGASLGQQSSHTSGWGYPSTSLLGEADWIDVEVIPVPASSYRFMDGQNGRPGNGPTSPTSYTGDLIVGITFETLVGGGWLEGYWYWVCPSGGLQQQQKFALWQQSGGNGTLISGSVVTSSGSLAAGWNYVALPVPVQLANNTPYVAATGVNGAFAMSDTTGAGTGAVDTFGTGGHTAGIRNGPIFAYSNYGDGGIAPGPYDQGQGLMSTTGTDPSATFPGAGVGNAANMWIDVQVTMTPPSSYKGSYRAWPNNYVASPYVSGDSTVNYVLSTEMHLSAPCTLNRIWYFSPGGTNQFATECAVWSIDTQTKVAENISPTWFKPDGSAGVAGSGWLYANISSTTLPAGRYRVSIYNDAASPDSWSAKQLYYYNIGDGASNYAGLGMNSTGPTWYGIKNGPVYVPNLTNASPANYYNNVPDLGGPGPGQAIFAVGPPNAFPNTYVKGLGQNYWVDMEVTPFGSNSSILLALFP